MELNQFRHLIAVAEEQHFGRAAAKLGMTQPPLSQSIQRLEREFGVALFERSRKGARLTEAGQAILPEARATVAAAARAKILAHAIAEERDPVTIGMTSPSLWGPLPELIRAARDEGIPLRLEQMSTNDQIPALTEGRVDIGIVSPPFDIPQRLRVEDVSTEPIIAALPESIAPDGDVPLSLLADRLILFPQAQGPTLHARIMGMFASQNVTPVVIQEANELLMTLALVAAGFGASLVPAGIGRNVPMRGVAYRRLAAVDDVPPWPFAVAYMPLAVQSRPARILARWRQIRSEGPLPYDRL
ncbi:LysR family transcriptional regulator [Agrobacterium tumefaciens]